MPADLLLVNAALSGGFGICSFISDKIPLIDDDNDRAPTLMCITRDRRIASSHAFRRINQHQRDVGGFKVLARHHDRKLLSHQLGLPFATNSCGIYETVLKSI